MRRRSIAKLTDLPLGSISSSVTKLEEKTHCWLINFSYRRGYQLCIVLRISMDPIQQSSFSDDKRQARTIVSTNSRIKLPLLRQLRQVHTLQTDSHQPPKLDRAEQATHIFFQRLAFLVLRAHTKRRKATLRWPSARAPATNPVRIVPAHRMRQPWDSHTCRWND